MVPLHPQEVLIAAYGSGTFHHCRVISINNASNTKTSFLRSTNNVSWSFLCRTIGIRAKPRKIQRILFNVLAQIVRKDGIKQSCDLVFCHPKKGALTSQHAIDIYQGLTFAASFPTKVKQCVAVSFGGIGELQETSHVKLIELLEGTTVQRTENLGMGIMYEEQ